MLSTVNIVETSRVPKTLVPGEQKVKINSITLGQGYEANSYNVHLNVEGPDMGPDFEGFFKDADAKSGPRYTGQIGRVRLYPFAYKDGVTKSGIAVDRDQSILKGLVGLANAIGKRDKVDAIKASTIEDFVAQASIVLSGPTFINMILGGKTYDKGGYTQYDLFIPIDKTGKVGFELSTIEKAASKLMKYDPAVHIVGSKVAAKVDSFEPTGLPDNSLDTTGADFNQGGDDDLPF